MTSLNPFKAIRKYLDIFFEQGSIQQMLSDKVFPPHKQNTTIMTSLDIET